MKGQLEFTRAEMARIRTVCQALGTSYAEFIHFATMQAVTEVEGYAREAYRPNPGLDSAPPLEKGPRPSSSSSASLTERHEK